MDQIVTNLGSEYVAVSEWGAYKEEVSREIVDTAKYTMENFEYNEEILNIPEMAAIFDSYRIETTGYIKRGIIGFDEENYPILGIAIGQELKHKEVTVGGEVYEVFDESQNMATYAADKLSFWVNGVEVAYLSNSELVVTRIIVIVEQGLAVVVLGNLHVSQVDLALQIPAIENVVGVGRDQLLTHALRGCLIALEINLQRAVLVGVDQLAHNQAVDVGQPLHLVLLGKLVRFQPVHKGDGLRNGHIVHLHIQNRG